MTELKRNVTLPCKAEELIPHRDAMLFINSFLERNRDEGSGVADAVIPKKRLFYDSDAGLFPEYLVELMAQTTAAINGFDAKEDAVPLSKGFLVGVDAFSWDGEVSPGAKVIIRMKKTFEFGAVTIMEGSVEEAGKIIASGRIKVWEEDKA